MNYVNPWADCNNFIYLGDMYTREGNLVDLYALKDHHNTGKPHYQIGVRYSNEPSDYGSGSCIRFDNGSYQTSTHHTREAWFAIQRLIKQVIKQPVYSDNPRYNITTLRTENTLLFNSCGDPCYTFKILS
jgi:hypothetical protein